MTTKKISYLFLLLPAFLLLQACEKDKDKDEDIFYISAGYYDSAYEYHKFENPIILDAKVDLGGYSMRASDTIPLEIDKNIVNLFARICYANPDSFGAIIAKDSFVYQYLELFSYSKMHFMIEDRSYYVGLGQSATFNFVKALDNGSLIYNNSKWSNEYFGGKDKWFSMWDFPLNIHSTIYQYDGGCWYNLNGIKYIGFNYNGRIGWIEVDISSKYNPIFVAYAIKK